MTTISLTTALRHLTYNYHYLQQRQHQIYRPMAAAQTSNPAKHDALSRALGAAFLNHQVEMLEQTVESRQTPRSLNARKGREPKKAPGAFRGDTPKRSPDAPRHSSFNNSIGSVNQNQPGLDADVIITDSSLLIHSLSYLQLALHPPRHLLKDGKTTGPMIVVPLEVLNTLDLLKKGSAPSAKRAREASRLLEREVGENPQIRVQRETEYITWNDVNLASADEVKIPLPLPPKSEQSEPNTIGNNNQSPEWARRTICCAQWEVLNAHKTLQDPKVFVAVCTSGNLPNPSKHDFRAGGGLMSYWASRAGLGILDLPVDPPKPAKESNNKKSRDRSNSHPNGRGRGGDGQRSSSEVERGPVESIILSNGPRPVGAGVGRGNGGTTNLNSAPTLFSPNGISSSPPKFKTIKTRHHEGNAGRRAGPGAGGKGLVEKPPMVQPNIKVMRVLARGEKLDPDD